MSAKGFFAIGPKEWAKVCKLGLHPAVALLVLARGSGPDNVTTSWSAKAVFERTGIGWLRAKAAIDALERAKLASIEKQGTHPRRKLAIPKDLEGALWLPNALIDGAGKETPPVKRLRQAQNLEHLQAFIELYGLQDLAGDGGLPRSLVQAPFKRERICDTGQFTVYGFTQAEARTCWNTGPLERFSESALRSTVEFLRGADRRALDDTPFLFEPELIPPTGIPEDDNAENEWHKQLSILHERMRGEFPTRELDAAVRTLARVLSG